MFPVDVQFGILEVRKAPSRVVMCWGEGQVGIQGKRRGRRLLPQIWAATCNDVGQTSTTQLLESRAAFSTLGFRAGMAAEVPAAYLLSCQRCGPQGAVRWRREAILPGGRIRLLLNPPSTIQGNRPEPRLRHWAVATITPGSKRCTTDCSRLTIHD